MASLPTMRIAALRVLNPAYSIADVAERFGGISKWTVLNWIHEGVKHKGRVHKLTPMRTKPSTIFAPHEVERWDGILADQDETPERATLLPSPGPSDGTVTLPKPKLPPEHWHNDPTMWSEEDAEERAEIRDPVVSLFYFLHGKGHSLREAMHVIEEEYRHLYAD